MANNTTSLILPGTVNIALNLATVLIPEVIALGKAIADLFRKHPAMTSEQFADLVKALADEIHATNADTLAALAAIPDPPPVAPPGA